MEFGEHAAKVVRDYRSSPAFEEEFFVKSNAYFDRSCTHILCQFHQYIPNKALMCRAFERPFTNHEFRGNCSFAPFTNSELEGL